jgi:23S rRNA G2445 N2-methylase RlmL
MKKGQKNTDKKLYQQLRALPCDMLWNHEVALFDRATPEERLARVALIRAVGVVFSESGSASQKEEARKWLLELLRDPCEKIRRYAMGAMPKIGVGPREEAELLSLLRATKIERERKFLGEALDKIGGAATLETLVEGAAELNPQTEHKVKASVARAQSPSTIRMEGVLSDFGRLRVHLRCRKGLEHTVREEVEQSTRTQELFRVGYVGSGLLELIPVAPFTLADIYTLRCFASAGFVIGTVKSPEEDDRIEAFASAITSPLSRSVLNTFTAGSIRYRLSFESKGPQRSVVRLVANRAYALCPEILNDARKAPWAVDIHPSKRGDSVELRPRLSPDPRFFYRERDVPAASHPPLAACMARVAGRVDEDIVWDPFCGSGLELIERTLLGGVRKVYGTDLSSAAMAIMRTNFASANLKSVTSQFTCADFHDFAKVEGLGPNSVTLIITNPPMGRRVRVLNLRQLIEDLFSVAAESLRLGGRLVFANPIKMESPQPSLQLRSRQTVDLGGFDCRLEMYVKAGEQTANERERTRICEKAETVIKAKSAAQHRRISNPVK